MDERWERDNFRNKVYVLKAMAEDVLAELDTADDRRMRELIDGLVNDAFSASAAATGYGSFLRRQRGRKAADADLLKTIEGIARIGGNVDVRA